LPLTAAISIQIPRINPYCAEVGLHRFANSCLDTSFPIGLQCGGAAKTRFSDWFLSIHEGERGLPDETPCSVLRSHGIAAVGPALGPRAEHLLVRRSGGRLLTRSILSGGFQFWRIPHLQPSRTVH